MGACQMRTEKGRDVRAIREQTRAACGGDLRGAVEPNEIHADRKQCDQAPPSEPRGMPSPFRDPMKDNCCWKAQDPEQHSVPEAAGSCDREESTKAKLQRQLDRRRDDQNGRDEIEVRQQEHELEAPHPILRLDGREQQQCHRGQEKKRMIDRRSDRAPDQSPQQDSYYRGEKHREEHLRPQVAMSQSIESNENQPRNEVAMFVMLGPQVRKRDRVRMSLGAEGRDRKLVRVRHVDAMSIDEEEEI